jgi:hypothetical protein
MRKAHWFGALALGVVLAGAGPAQAQVQGDKSGSGKASPAKRESVDIEGSANNFGAPAQIVISQDFTASISYDSREPNGFFFDVAPSLDYFILENISIGAAVSLAFAITDADDSFDVGLAGRVGYALPLRDSVSLWPRLSMGFQRRDTPTPGGASETDTDFVIGAFVPALMHITPNFFIGAGPDLEIIPGGNNDGVTLAVRTTLGGNF